MFVNHLCELKGEQDGEADKAEEGFCELVIASGNAPIALDFFEEVFYPVTTPVDGCREWHSRSAVSASRNAGSVLPPKKRTRDSRFSLVCYRRNQGTLSPEPPGIFRFGLAPAGPAGPAGPPGSGHAASPQSSIFRYGMDTLPSVDPSVNYSVKLCFVLVRCLVAQRAMQAQVVIINLDIFE